MVTMSGVERLMAASWPTASAELTSRTAPVAAQWRAETASSSHLDVSAAANPRTLALGERLSTKPLSDMASSRARQFGRLALEVPPARRVVTTNVCHYQPRLPRRK